MGAEIFEEGRQVRGKGPGPQQSRSELDQRLSALMVQAQAGDNEAYALLLSTVTAWLRRYLWAQWQGIPKDLHDDVIQDVLLSLHSARRTYDGSQSFLPWLRAIARNRAVDHLRQAQRYSELLNEYSASDVTFYADATNKVEDQGLAEKTIEKGLLELPESQRQAIRMIKIDQLSFADASRRTGVRAGTLKVRVHRALKTLQEFFSSAGRGGR